MATRASASAWCTLRGVCSGELGVADCSNSVHDNGHERLIFDNTSGRAPFVHYHFGRPRCMIALGWIGTNFTFGPDLLLASAAACPPNVRRNKVPLLKNTRQSVFLPIPLHISEDQLFAPCFEHSPRARAQLSQPATEQLLDAGPPASDLAHPTPAVASGQTMRSLGCPNSVLRHTSPSTTQWVY